jgi:hypothetical protein
MAKKKTSQVKAAEDCAQVVAASEVKSPAAFFDAVAKLLDAWNSYDEDHAGFWAAVDAANTAQPQPMDASERFEVHAAFIAFAGELEAYDNRPDPETEPHAAFWQTLDAVHVAFTKPASEPRRPESIASLLKQGVTPTQVCGMWGLVDEHQRPQIDNLEQEQATPGSVIGEAYEWPTLRRYRDERVAKYAAYVSAIIEKHRADSAAGRKPCKESPEELYRQAVPADQAARMLCIEPAEAAKLWTKFEAKLGKPEQGVPVTDARGEPLPEYVPITRIEEVVDEPAPRTSSTYGDLEEAELRELCLASELSDEGDRDELIARLEKQDSEGVPA